MTNELDRHKNCATLTHSVPFNRPSFDLESTNSVTLASSEKNQHDLSSKKSGNHWFLRGEMYSIAVKIVYESANQNSTQSDFFWYCENMIKMLIDATDKTYNMEYNLKMAAQYCP